MDIQLIIAVVVGISLLLVMILRLKLQAFLALLIASILVGIISGMPPLQIVDTIKEGMGSTLGFVAVVVGLGAMFGALLEHSGGASVFAGKMLERFGQKRSPVAMMISGFFIAIPVFFDVAFIILIPIIYALQRRSGQSLLLYAIPLLAGLAVTHAFIPPTPGPIAVAEIIDADLGWVIVFGFLVGIPTAIISGPVFGRFIAKRIHIVAPEVQETEVIPEQMPSIGLIGILILTPIVLIVFNTLFNSPLGFTSDIPQGYKTWIGFVGHPFTALIIANLLAWYLLGVRKKFKREALMRLSTRSLEPAGIIILLTGAGGVFKQMLINTGSGEMLANQLNSLGIGPLLFAFLIAAIVRILQGSATVAMITSAGITAPMISNVNGEMHLALLVIAIASGASILSHVNDSGFWLVSKYLGLSEKQTFRSWTVMTTIIACTGFITAALLWILLPS